MSNEIVAVIIVVIHGEPNVTFVVEHEVRAAAAYQHVDTDVKLFVV